MTSPPERVRYSRPPFQKKESGLFNYVVLAYHGSVFLPRCSQDFLKNQSVRASLWGTLRLVGDGKIDALCQYFVGTCRCTGPVNFDVGWTCSAIDGIRIACSGTRGYGEGKLGDLFIVQIPNEADGPICTVGVDVEGDVYFLVDLKCGRQLQGLSRSSINQAGHLGVINILLARKCSSSGG